MSKRNFEKNLLNIIQKEKLVYSGCTVLAAVSGGADSTALLLALNSVKEAVGFTLCAIHVNHNLRGDESDRDELFVRDLCEKLKIPLRVASCNVKSIEKKLNISTELAARIARYNEFINEARGYSGCIVATAHTQDDNAETILHNLIRGTGLKGLCGIPQRIEKESIVFIRPLLKVTRKEIIEYLDAYGQSFVTDSTNADEKYTRNAIRHNIKAYIEERLNPSFSRTISRMSEGLIEDEEYLNSKAQEFLSKALIYKDDNEIILSAEKIKDFHNAISTRIIAVCMKSLSGIDYERSHIEAGLDISSKEGFKEASVPANLNVYKSGDKLVFRKDNETLEPYCKELKKGETFIPNIGKFHVLSQDDPKVNCLLIKERISYDKISKNLVVRSRRSGDRIVLNTSAGGKTLKKLFIELKIPAEKRIKIPVICDGDMPIAIMGYGVTPMYKPDKNTKDIMIIGLEESKL
ncbi:MAG: tRNA lysidine(34) synthetase TilS [Bacillota bacterium]|nr:tRNA lysidine(34) synthetase TilS [Bacillota bacterium]